MHGSSLAPRKVLTLLLCLSGTFPALALAADPLILPTVDANGVELLNGTFQVSVTDISIGIPGAGGLSVGRTLYPNAPAFSSRGYIRKTAWNQYLIAIGNFAESFYSNDGTNYYSNQARGSQLAKIAGGYQYISSTGDKVVFAGPASQYSGYLNTISSITKPSGEITRFHYESGNMSTCSADHYNCTFWLTEYRLRAISNNFGYQIRFYYNADGDVDDTQYSQWQTVGTIKAINTKDEYCDPNAPCYPTQPWPTVYYDTDYDGTYTVTDATGAATRYRYDYSSGTGITFSIRNPGSSSDDIVYSSSIGLGGLMRVNSVAANGRSWNYVYTFDGAVVTTRITDNLNRVREITFDTVGQPASDKNAAGEITLYQNDSFGRTTRVTLPTGNYFESTLDQRGNVINLKHYPVPGSSEPVLEWITNYDADCTEPRKCNKPNWTKDPEGNQTSFTYSPVHFAVTEVTAPAVPVPTVSGLVSPKTKYEYEPLQARYKNTQGNIVASGEAVYMLVSTSTCREGASVCPDSANELRTELAYGSMSVGNNLLPREVKTRNGNATAVSVVGITYNSVGDVVHLEGPLDGDDSVAIHYDDARRVVGRVSGDPDGSANPRIPVATRTLYDTHFRAYRIETGTVPSQSLSSWSQFSPSQAREFEFDAAGRVTKVKEFAGSDLVGVQHLGYDGGGRVTCSAVRMNKNALNSAPSACEAGQAGSAGPDQILSFGYDNIDRLTSITKGVGVAPYMDRQAFYLPNGQLDRIIDGNGNTTVFTYDEFNRRKQTRYPNPADGSASAADYEEFGYNKNSQVTSLRRRDGTPVGYHPDALGRIDFVDVPGTDKDIHFRYDLQGRLRKASYGSAGAPGIDIAYDGLGRPYSRSYLNRAVTTTYNKAGQRESITYPGSNPLTINYDFSPAGELTRIRQGSTTLAGYVYDTASRVKEIRAPNSVRYVDYTPRSLPWHVTDDLSGASYDRTVTFEYAPSGQLSSRKTDKDAVYAWLTGASGSVATAPDGQNKLHSYNGVTTQSTGAGEARTLNGFTYQYDALGRLIGGTTSETNVSVEYDPLGMLSKVVETDIRTQVSRSTEYVYDGANLVAEYKGGEVANRFVHGLSQDQLIAWYAGASNSSPNFFVTDERGSVIAATNNSGQVTGVTRYSAYGMADSMASSFGFTGQVWVNPLKLYFFKARMYSPNSGRFMQPDPLGYEAGMNLYAYAGGDPINSVDPTGLWSCVRGTDQAHRAAFRTAAGAGGTLLEAYTEWYDVPTEFCTDNIYDPGSWPNQPNNPGPTDAGGATPQNHKPIGTCPQPVVSASSSAHKPGQFNPTKLGTAFLSAANAGRLAASGVLKLTAGTAVGSTGVGAVPGGGMILWGAWNLHSAGVALDKASFLARESVNENFADASARNFQALAPMGQHFDDPGEPSALQFYLGKAQHLGCLISELGTLSP